MVVSVLHRAGLSAIPMKLMDDYPERVVVGFAFWPFVSLLNFTLVPRRFHLLVLNLAGFLWGVISSSMA